MLAASNLALSHTTDDSREMGYSSEFRRQSHSLQTVDLAYRDLSEISNYLADQHGAIVEFLDLSHNKIRSFQGLARFQRLSTLVLDHNGLTSVSMFPPLPHLHTLWLNHNHIEDLSVFLRALRFNCPSLVHLSMLGNPCVPSLSDGHSRGQLYRYRIEVLMQFPSLISLDQQRVEAWERPESDSLWSQFSSAQHWQQLQRKISNRAAELADNMYEFTNNSFDRIALWWESLSEDSSTGRSSRSAYTTI